MLITFWSQWCWRLRALYFKTDKKLKDVETLRNIMKYSPSPFPQVLWIIVLLEPLNFWKLFTVGNLLPQRA